MGSVHSNHHEDRKFQFMHASSDMWEISYPCRGWMYVNEFADSRLRLKQSQQQSHTKSMLAVNALRKVISPSKRPFQEASKRKTPLLVLDLQLVKMMASTLHHVLLMSAGGFVPDGMKTS